MAHGSVWIQFRIQNGSYEKDLARLQIGHSELVRPAEISVYIL